tara:strand:+ start:1013 stop:1960 length:948 start_codon:yes stop_codon:yes gene_type:complete
MMYNEVYYFDGCSYTAGHDTVSTDRTWISILNPLVEKDGNYNLSNPNFPTGGRRKYPYYNESVVCKSNQEIYQDWRKNLPALEKLDNVKVVIHWSHSERTTQDKNQGFITGNNHWTEDLATAWWDGFDKTVSFMKTIEDDCKIRNIEVYFITTEHQQLFELARNYNDEVYSQRLDSLDQDIIFNWPMRKLQNFNLTPVTRDDLLILWGCTGLPVSWCRVFGEDTADDLKHIDYRSQQRFGAQIKDWIVDRNKDLSYWIDEGAVDKSYFYDLATWKNNYRSADPEQWVPTHWIERDLNEILINTVIRPNADYIYES